MEAARVRILIDNAAIDSMLKWSPDDQSRLYSAVDNRRMVVYLAPETAAEMLSIGGTSRASQLRDLASFQMRIFNGRVLNQHYCRIRDEVRCGVSRPFLPAGEARSLIERLRQIAKGSHPPDSDWFRHGAELTRKAKVDDQAWRTGFQQMWREREREANKAGLPLKEFIKSVTVKELVLSRVEAICSNAGVKNPKARASELLAAAFKGCPALTNHVWMRIARLWWYTEATREGRKASPDLFDDALLGYLVEHNILVTPDRALTDFGRTALVASVSEYAEKKLLTPEAFRAEYLDGA